MYLIDNTYNSVLDRVPIENVFQVIARRSLTVVSFVCQIISGGKCVRPVQSILPQRASDDELQLCGSSINGTQQWKKSSQYSSCISFHCFFGAYGLWLTVERDVTRGIDPGCKTGLFGARGAKEKALPWLRRLALASSAMSSSLNRMSTSICRLCIKRAAACGTG
ncbi:hypothetical protein BCR43DRAFT_494913, partial [Syncephalastrum racemosum]